MSSWESIQFLLFTEKIASRLLLTPISWDTKRQEFIRLKQNPKAKNYYWIRRPVGICILILHFLTISYMLYNLKLQKCTSIADWMPFTFLTGAYMLALSVHVNFLRLGNEFPELYNSYIFMSKNAPFSRGKSPYDRRLVLVMKLIFGLACLTVIAGFPGALYCIQYKVVGFQYFGTNSVVFNILTALIGWWLGVIDWVVITSVVYVIIIHTDGISAMQLYMIRQWTAKRERPLSRKTKWKLHMYYRIQQIQHTMAMRLASSLLPFLIPASEGIIVIGVFAVLKYFRIIHILISLTAISTCMSAGVILKVAIQLANGTIKNSYIYQQVYKKQYDTQLSNLDRMYFCSYRPLDWIVGNSFRIKQDTFPKILQNVIMDNVLNLLVYSRTST